VEKAKAACSVPESRLVNAVARRLAARLASAGASTVENAEPSGGLAAEFSHPDWLVARWIAAFGPDAPRRLLAWNQEPAPVHVRWRGAADAPVPDFLTPARWPGFYAVGPGHWDEVRRLAEQGVLYVQDPSTRLAVDLLAPRAGEAVLDACAAPGGKSLLIADALAADARATGNAGGPAGTVVALDAPAEPGGDDPRLLRLRENLSRAPKPVRVALVEADLRRTTPDFLRRLNLPSAYDAVLLDAPCSNTGVMRHRVDVKWRLREGDFARHATGQGTLLRAAARLVRPGGRLVYSTCSLDPEENQGVVERFLREVPGWRLGRAVQARPWTDGHDGVGAFLLEARA
jgi:16S rRNA (cytosine967-C5)-methyltransferase